MLQDGKEVFEYNLTTLQSFNVQKKINEVPEFQEDAKTDAVINSNGEIESKINPGDSVSQDFSLGMFETLGGVQKSKGLNSREQYYATYNRMSKLGLVQRGLEVISDEASQKNDDNKVIKIASNNEKIESCLNKLFFDKLSINTELWPMFYETLKIGDDFYEVVLDVNKDNMATGISRIKYIDPAKIDIHEKEGKIDYYIYKNISKNKRGASSITEQKLLPWQILHFKMENKETKPYGRSILYSGIRSFERLTATEDIFLTYIISRTPSRRVFKIDVGGLPQLEAQRAIRNMRDAYRSQQVIDNEGNLNQISSILSITSDIFIPVREGQQTTIETLPNDLQNVSQGTTFIDNFKKDLISSLNVPAEYLIEGQNGATDKSTTLAQKDIKFARFVERVQQQIIKPLYKIATLELFFNGFKGEDLKNFTLELTPPSTIKETTEQGLLDSKINILSNIKSLDMFPTSWMLKKVLQLTDKEISEINFLNMLEKQNEQQEMGSGMGGGLPTLGGMEQNPQGEIEAPEAGEELPAGEEGQQPENAEVANEPETLNQSVSYLNIDGQKFLIENKKDFITLMKYINEQKKLNNQKQSEFVNIISNGEKKQEKPAVVPNPFTFYENINEYGGLNLKLGRECKMYEGAKLVEIKILEG